MRKYVNARLRLGVQVKETEQGRHKHKKLYHGKLRQRKQRSSTYDCRAPTYIWPPTSLLLQWRRRCNPLYMWLNSECCGWDWALGWDGGWGGGRDWGEERKRGDVQTVPPSFSWPRFGTCSRTRWGPPAWPDPGPRPECRRPQPHYWGWGPVSSCPRCERRERNKKTGS